MLCPRPTPLNRRPTVQNLPNPHRAPSREAGSFFGQSSQIESIGVNSGYHQYGNLVSGFDH